MLSGRRKATLSSAARITPIQMAFAEKYENEIDAFAKDYMDFLGTCKTVRESVAYFEAKAKRDGFVNWESFYESGKIPKAGDRFYFNNRRKNLVLFIIGEKPIKEGIHQMVSHLDANHLYLKFNPLYEKLGFALAHTKTFGGIKKFQWLSQPLAIHGVVYTREGKRVDIVIGEDAE